MRSSLGPPRNTPASLQRCRALEEKIYLPPTTEETWTPQGSLAGLTSCLGPFQTLSPTTLAARLPLSNIRSLLAPLPSALPRILATSCSSPELNSPLQLPSVIRILNKCFLSLVHLISRSSPMAEVQEPQAALRSLLILNLPSEALSPSSLRFRERPGGVRGPCWPAESAEAEGILLKSPGRESGAGEPGWGHFAAPAPTRTEFCVE